MSAQNTRYVPSARHGLAFAVLSLMLLVGAPQAWTQEKPCELKSINEALRQGLGPVSVKSTLKPNSFAVFTVEIPNQPRPGRIILGHYEKGFVSSAGGDGLSPQWRKKLQSTVNALLQDAKTQSFLKTCATVGGDGQKHLEDLLSAARKKGAQSKTVSREERAIESPSASFASVYVQWFLPICWLVFLVLCLLALRDWWTRLRQAKPLLLALITLLAFILRLTLPDHGASDISNTLYHAYAGAERLQDFGPYGRGLEGLLIPLLALFPYGDDTVVWMNILFGVLTVPVFFAWVRRLGYSTVTAYAASFCLAIAPLHVRFTPTTNRYIVLLFLCLLGWLFLLNFLESGKWRELALATVSTALATQCRPEMSVLPVACVGLVVALSLHRPSRPEVMRHIKPLCLAFVILIALIFEPVRNVLGDSLSRETWITTYVQAERNLFDFHHNAYLFPLATGVAWPLLAVLGLTVAPNNNRWLVLWTALGALGFSYVASQDLTITGYPEAVDLLDVRYHLSALPFFLILTAAGIGMLAQHLNERMSSSRRDTPRWLVTGFIIGCGALGCTAYPSMMRSTTMAQEYAFFKRHLQAVPDGCAIIAFDAKYDLGFRAPEHLSMTLGKRHRWLMGNSMPRKASKHACLVYAHMASCSMKTEMQEDQRGQSELCQRLMATKPSPIATMKVEKAPAGGYAFKGDEPSIGLYWLKRPSSP